MMIPKRKLQFLAVPIKVQAIQQQVQLQIQPQQIHFSTQIHQTQPQIQSQQVQLQIQPQQLQLQIQPQQMQPEVQLQQVQLETQPQLTPQLLPDSVANEILANQKRRKVLDMQTEEIVSYVLKKCEKEYEQRVLFEPLACTRARAAMYTGLSESTVRRIRLEENKQKEMGQSKQPCRKQQRKRKRDCRTTLDDRDMITIKNLIRDYYIKHREVPILPKLMLNVMDEVPTYNSRTYLLRKVLRDIGYLRKKHYSKRAVLVENPEIIALRDNYLQTMKELRNQKTKNIFYIYECVIDRSFTLYKSWGQKYNSNDALRNKNTFTFICAASEKGFLKQCALLQRTGFDKQSCVFGGQLTPEYFEKWLRSIFIPNLPEHSIVIMEDAPHHCILKDKPISYHSTKEHMIEYLRKKNVVCNENMRRSELYKLVEKKTPKHKVYVVDDILQENGHKAMRLPPFMIDLSPTQHAMDKIQGKLFENECEASRDFQKVVETLEGFISSITEEDWWECFEKVKLLEEEYWKKDGEFEVAIDEVLLNLRDCVDSGSEESDLDSESDDSDKT